MEIHCIKEILSYKEVSVEIFYRQGKKLRNKKVASVKVLRRNQRVEGASSEAEDDMVPRYPYIFPSNPNLA